MISGTCRVALFGERREEREREGGERGERRERERGERGERRERERERERVGKITFDLLLCLLLYYLERVCTTAGNQSKISSAYTYNVGQT